MEKEKQFNGTIFYKGKVISFKLPYIQGDFVSIENYCGFPVNDKIPNISILVQDADLDYDIHSIMVKPNQTGVLSDTMCMNLIGLIKEHIMKYGRLLPVDFFTYINKMIFIMSVISEYDNDPLTKSEGETIFKETINIFWNAFPNEIKEFIKIAGNNDNDLITKYTVNKFCK